MGHKEPPFLFSLRSSSAFVTFSVAYAIFTDMILYAFMVPVFPFSLETRIHLGRDDVQKWVSILLGMGGLGIFVGSPVFGWMADHWNNRRVPLLSGMVLLLLSNFLLWFGRSLALLVIARILIGLSSACVWSVGLALISDSVPKERVGRAMGFVAIGTDIGYMIGPTLGGSLFNELGYDAVFIVGTAMIVVDIVFRLLLIERKDALAYMPTDVLDSQRPLIPKPSPTLKPDGKKRKLPAFLIILKSPRFLMACFAGFSQAVIGTSIETTLPLHLRKLFGYNPTQIGLVFIAFVVPGVISPWIGNIANRRGAKWFTVAGFLLSGPAAVLLRLPTMNSPGSQAAIIILMMLIGLGDKMIMTPTLMELGLSIEETETNNPGDFGEQGAKGQGYAMSNLAFAGGMMAGPLWSGGVVENQGWAVMTLILGIYCMASAIPAVIFTGGAPENPEHSVAVVSDDED